ncbi:MAG: hypothetical protein UY05_C0031G0003 [Candidatus Peregrinibacteria bacterium GW2011_GWA2_47_7]|nr:MAG: hypothetical protein UY05_C0031G0003 [Candidatus Peregrinibacteria bacterium GW2011_GWA2_47_7]
MGFLVVAQFESFRAVKTVVSREKNPSAFRDIQILKKTTDNLRNEIRLIEKKEQELLTVTSSLQALESQKLQYELLAGEISVTGPGIVMTFSNLVPSFWFTDLINELTTAGAEAVAVNGLRLTSEENGFRVVLPYTLTVGDNVFYAPFTIEAISDKEALYGALMQSGGYIDRLTENERQIKLQLIKKDSIVLE